jgi:uncharacterized protein YjcR
MGRPTKYDYEKVKEMYLSSFALKDIAREVGCRVQDIWNILTRIGINPSRKKEGKAGANLKYSKIEVLVLYQNGFSLEEIAEKLGGTKEKINCFLQNHLTEYRKKYKPRKND